VGVADSAAAALVVEAAERSRGPINEQKFGPLAWKIKSELLELRYSLSTLENQAEMEKILYVTYDKQSFINRSGALLRSGFRVSSPRTADDAIPLAAANNFFAVVIGNSVLHVDRVRVIQGIRKIKPGLRILYVTNVPNDVEPEADGSIDVSQDFGKLLNSLHELEQWNAAVRSRTASAD
jgi:hypothetical protein